MANNIVMCNHKHTDCFRYYCGECLLLSEQIHGKECPFYKTKSEFEKRLPHNPRVEDVIKAWEERMS